MVKEFNALTENDTWCLVPYHYDMNFLSCKWVHHIKYNSNGSIMHQ